MCFLRKPSLGQYNVSRSDWLQAYRSARSSARKGNGPNPKHSGIEWKAELIVANERGEWVDPLVCPVEGRLEAQRIINSICTA